MWIPQASAVADLTFFPVATAIAFFGLRSSSLEPRQKKILGGAMLVSVLAKVALASLGHNFDVESYRLVSAIMEDGQSVYANTDRYNYGPIWAWIVAGFGHIAGPGIGEQFHVWIAAFLAMVDVLIGLAIARAYSWTGGLVFLLSPVSLLITGFHSQFDNLAVLMGLLAWLLIRGGKPKPAAFLLSAGCLGISLIVKHILILFPIWLLCWKPLGKLRYRILYALIAWGLFGASFLPWWSDPLSRAGIQEHVFTYSSSIGFSWLAFLLDFFVPTRYPLGLSPWFPQIKLIWMALVAATGLVLARKGVREMYLPYLLLLYASSPAITNQYQAIPMLAVAVYYTAAESWAFCSAATLADLIIPTNVGIFWQQAIRNWSLPYFVIAGHGFFTREVIEASYRYFLFASQFCAGALLLRLWRQRGVPAGAPSVWGGIWRSACLIAVGGLPAIEKSLKP